MICVNSQILTYHWREWKTKISFTF